MANETRILIVEDDEELGEMLRAYFREQGYEARAIPSGEEALEWLKRAKPAVIVLDIYLPGIDGFEVGRRLRHDGRFRQTPLIFLTERRALGDRLTGLGLGPIDYMTKPFDVRELGLRVRNVVARSILATQTNPVTGLPESAATSERLAAMVGEPDWGVVLAGLSGLRNFSDEYGFVVADDVARASSMMIRRVVESAGGCDYLGHLEPAEFVIITSARDAAHLAELCRQRLGSTIPYFYPAADWQALQASPEADRLTLHVTSFTSASKSITTLEDLHQALQSTL